MILEKDKVYKVRHDRRMFEADFPRDYIIFSPKKDVLIPDDFFTSVKFPYRNDRSFKTNFTVCFNETILYKDSSTSVDTDCVFLSLKLEDHDDIRKAVKLIGNGCLYNRKLNKLIFDAKEGTCI